MKLIRTSILAVALGAAVPFASPPLSRAIAAAPAGDPATVVQGEIDKGLEYLKSQQKPDGTWQEKENEPPALTAICLRAFVGDPRYINQPFVKKGFDKLLTYQKEDGSISSDVLATYNTAIATSALALSDDPKYKAAAQKAVAYLRSIQWTDKIEGIPNQAEKVDPSNPNYGGWGYGHDKKGGRPDLSNAQMALEALHDAGLKPGDPAFEAAKTFITRCQNNSETNKESWAMDDGGFVYTPALGGKSEAGETTGPGGKRELRSYGSMTYAGLKSMIYCGLTKDDARVKACWKWIGNNWTMQINPGMQFAAPKNPKSAESGLYYYYHTLARALRTYGEPVITDAKGVKHDWRVELIEQLASEQQPNGHFAGTQRWMESRPSLATSFAVLSAIEAKEDLKDHPVGK